MEAQSCDGCVARMVARRGHRQAASSPDQEMSRQNRRPPFFPFSFFFSLFLGHTPPRKRSASLPKGPVPLTQEPEHIVFSVGIASP